MEKDKRLIITGIFTAIAASLCCITPVLALVSGVAGIASSFSWIEPLRPYLIGLTIIVLVFAWYQKIKPKKKINCDCSADKNSNFIHSKIFLGIVTVFAGFMLAFPYYSGSFFPNNYKKVIITEGTTNKSETITVNAENVEIINLDIEGMTCPACNYTVQNASLKVSGVFEAVANYQTGKAVIKFDNAKTNSTDIIKSINSTEYKVLNNN